MIRGRGLIVVPLNGQACSFMAAGRDRDQPGRLRANRRPRPVRRDIVVVQDAGA
jgi:hypothetical protein